MYERPCRSWSWKYLKTWGFSIKFDIDDFDERILEFPLPIWMIEYRKIDFFIFFFIRMWICIVDLLLFNYKTFPKFFVASIRLNFKDLSNFFESIMYILQFIFFLKSSINSSWTVNRSDYFRNKVSIHLVLCAFSHPNTRISSGNYIVRFQGGIGIAVALKHPKLSHTKVRMSLSLSL